MKPYVAVAGYLLAITMTIVLWNANIGAWWVGIGIWGCSSVLLGVVTGQLIIFVWAFAAIPIAFPFGIVDDYQYSEAIPLWWGAAVLSLFAAGLIVVAALARKAFDRRLRTVSDATST